MFKFLRFMKGGSSENRSAGPLRRSAIRPPMFSKRRKPAKAKPESPKKEPGIYNKTGYTTGKKLHEELLKAHSEIYKVPLWAARRRKPEIIEKYFRGEKKKHYSRKGLKRNLRQLEEERKSMAMYKRKDIRKRIEVFKKATDV